MMHAAPVKKILNNLEVAQLIQRGDQFGKWQAADSCETFICTIMSGRTDCTAAQGGREET